MRWLLDTNVVSESVRTRPDQRVVDWVARQPTDLVAISVVTVAELRVGVLAIENATRRQRYAQWLDRYLAELLGEQTLRLTPNILIDWLQLARALGRRGLTRQAPDLLIAATARVYNLIVVTRNARDFANTGVIVYDPWSGKTHNMDTP